MTLIEEWGIVTMPQGDWLTLILLFLVFGLLFYLLCLFLQPVCPMLQSALQVRMQQMHQSRKSSKQK